MAGGKLLGFLQNNPQLVTGVKTAVGGFLDSKGLGDKEKTESEPTMELKGKKEDKKQNVMIYVALGAVVLVMLMMKKK